MCLQEVDRVNDFYGPRLRDLGYFMMHYGRPGYFRGEGIAVAFKFDKFRVLERDFINMDDLSKIY